MNINNEMFSLTWSMNFANNADENTKSGNAGY